MSVRACCYGAVRPDRHGPAPSPGTAVVAATAEAAAVSGGLPPSAAPARAAGLADDAARAISQSTNGVAAATGRTESTATTITEAKIMHALRASDTPAGHATAKLLKRGRFQLQLRTTTGSNLGEIRFGSRSFSVFTNNVRDAREAAGVAAHEVRHGLQRLTLSTYHQGHELEALQWQKQVDPRWQTLNVAEWLQRNYSRIRAVPAGFTPSSSPNR